MGSSHTLVHTLVDFLSSEGGSPEARWRSQTEAALRDRLIQVVSGIFIYIIHVNTWKTRFPFIARTDFTILLVAAARSTFSGV